MKGLGVAKRSSLAADLVPRFPAEGGYVPHVPHPPQQAFLLLSHVAEVMYGGAAGAGKALALTTPLPTPSGWTTMGAVAVGDQLYDEEGQPCTVVAKSEVLVGRDVYRVLFSDGASILADGSHRWTTLSSGERQQAAHHTEAWRAARRANRPLRSTGARPDLAAMNRQRALERRTQDSRTAPSGGGGVVVASGARNDGIRRPRSQAWSKATTRTTEELLASIEAGNRPHAIPLAQPLSAPDVDLPVDPWVLGLWLGDGDKRRGYITIGVEDQAWTLAELARRGYVAVPQKGRGTHFRVVGLREQLVSLGLCGRAAAPVEKFLPAAYLRASARQRLEVLQGFVDSDGHVDPQGRVEVCQVKPQLVRDAAELLVSLGIKVTARESDAVLNGRVVGRRWRLVFVHPQAALMPRKASRLRAGEQRSRTRYVVAVEPVPSVPVQCVTVDSPSALYLAGEAMVPTHNSDSLLMAALQYADVPGYSALILRRTFPDLTLPGAIMSRAETWLSGTPARKKEGGKRWEFPTNDPERPAILQFGYAARHADIYRYQGAELSFFGVDELTQIEGRTYEYLFSRLRGPSITCAHCKHPTSQVAGERRSHDEDHDHCACGHEHQPRRVCDECGCDDYRPVACECLVAEADRDARDEEGRPLLVAADDGTTLADVPLRARSATNPGGVGHEYVRARFVDPKTKAPKAVFVRALLADNPSLDRKAYREGLSHLSAVERQRLEHGDWDAVDEGDLFKRDWFRIVDEAPAVARRVRAWDLAATVENPKKRNDPDWTVGALLALAPDGRWYVEDVVRTRSSPLEVEKLVAQTAALDGKAVLVRMEQEPGSSGVGVIDHYRRLVLPGYDFDGIKPTLSKQERAAPVARAAEASNLLVCSAPWNRVLIDEFCGFPRLPHDDQVDAVSLAMESLTTAKRARLIA